MLEEKYKQNFGAWGENLARRYYQKRDWQLLAQNYRTPYGELDLILQKNQHTLVVEVKTRKDRKYGWPEESVTNSKLLHLEHSALWAQKQLKWPGAWSLEIVAISVNDEKIELRRFQP